MKPDTTTRRRRKNATSNSQDSGNYRTRPLALLYIRVSTDQQRDLGASLPAQRQALITACERKGYTYEVIDADAGLSATSMTKRPGLLGALHRLKTGHADVLMAIAWDRLSRNLRDIADLMARSVDEGWGLWTAREDVDTGTPSGRLYVHIMGAVAEFSSAITGDRTRAAMAQRKREALERGEPSPFGRPHCTPPETIDLIRRLRDAGLGYSDIARYLNETGHPTARAHESRERGWREAHPDTEPTAQQRRAWAAQAMSTGEATWWPASVWRLVPPENPENTEEEAS